MDHDFYKIINSIDLETLNPVPIMTTIHHTSEPLETQLHQCGFEEIYSNDNFFDGLSDRFKRPIGLAVRISNKSLTRRLYSVFKGSLGGEYGRFIEFVKHYSMGLGNDAQEYKEIISRLGDEYVCFGKNTPNKSIAIILPVWDDDISKKLKEYKK